MKRTLGLALASLALGACATAGPGQPAAFVAVYRWTVKAGCERDFVAAWHAEAARYRDVYGSCGTRLSRADDGSFVAIAAWPSRERWHAAARPLDLPEAEAVLNRCVTSKVEELDLAPVDAVSSPVRCGP